MIPAADLEPFPHVIIDGGWDLELLRGVLAEFPSHIDQRWRRYGNDQERKLEGPPELWGERTHELFAQMGALAPMLAETFGMPPLYIDAIGGGYHLIPPGGFLNVHTDFTRSGGRYRRLNALVYLNEGWDDPGGHLELWDAGTFVKTVAPEMNRTLIFETSDHSWHGHPKPAERWRASFAAYFFSDEAPAEYGGDHSTVFRGH